MLGCSYGNALRLDPSDESRAVLRDAAAALATRYVPKLGMIRSWDHKPYQCPVIIDNMMNLELLSWAAAVMAPAFLELSTQVKNGKPYLDMTTRQLLTLSSPVPPATFLPRARSTCRSTTPTTISSKPCCATAP